MAKRKRDEPSVPSSASPEPSTDRALKRRRKLCAQRITAAQKSLLTALRLAAGFERQKFSRRKKTSQQKNDTKDLARLEAEYAKLKTLDLNKLAEQHLRKVIGKVKSLRESDALPESTKTIEKGEQDPALLNVQARLYKVDAVRRVVDEAIDDLKEVVGGAETSKEGPNDTTSKNKKAKRGDEMVEDLSDPFAAFDARIAAPSSGDEDSEDSLSDGLRPPSVEGGDSERDYDLDEESNEESGSDSDEASIPIPKAKRKVPAQERTSTSTFIPHLSHATYYSGTDSEASDLDADLAPRKNRRGQRARQKIWEQKYGEKAQHVRKQERNKGWDVKKGAVGDRRRGRGDKGAPRGRGPERTGENAMPLGPKKTKRDDTGPLHPSWLAAKAAKEKKIDAKPQGKKVVFD